MLYFISFFITCDSIPYFISFFITCDSMLYFIAFFLLFISYSMPFRYHLGPNGAILTSLNLFATKFGQVLECIDRRIDAATKQPATDTTPPPTDGPSQPPATTQGIEHILIDTPGQIEIFTWSASGSIITESLAAHYPTVLVYVMDASRSTSPITFMSNMLYACSILYVPTLHHLVK
jgi:hypothetical protein